MSNRFKARHAAPKGQIKAPDIQSINTETLTPLFCLAQMKGDGCVSACDQEQQAAFADTLRKLSQLTWAQIKQAPRHGLGSEIINRSSIAVKALPNGLSEDVNILAFRFWGKASMLCYRSREVLHIFWLDRDFTAYDHG